MNNIVYLKNKDIDKQKWNHCLDTAANGLIFGTSWFLDAVCENWDALVLGDYEAVMPLPWKKKYGLYYLIQPNYTKQLGVFGNFSPALEKQFVQQIPLKFLYVNFSGNEGMKHPYQLKRTTQVIDLSTELNFNKSTRKNIRRAVSQKLLYTEGAFNDYYVAYRNLDKHYINDSKLKVIQRFQQNKTILQHSIFCKVSDKHDNLHSIIWILEYKQRAYKISSATSEIGKRTKASFLAMEHYLSHPKKHIKEFDFMGSEIPGVHEYNKGFGAEERQFPIIKMNVFNRFLR